MKDPAIEQRRAEIPPAAVADGPGLLPGPALGPLEFLRVEIVVVNDPPQRLLNVPRLGLNLVIAHRNARLADVNVAVEDQDRLARPADQALDVVLLVRGVELETRIGL